MALEEDELSPQVEKRTLPEQMGPGAVFVALLTMVFWGGTAVSNQFALDVIPPILLGGLRFALAALFMAGWCLLEGSPLLLKRGQWTVGWIMGILLFLQIAAFNVGTDYSSSSNASILVNSYIFWVAGSEFLFFHTVRLNRTQWGGLILAGLGCACVFFNTGTTSPQSEDVPTLKGDLILALSGFLMAIKILYTKYAVRHISPTTLIFWHDILGALMFFVCSPLVGEKVTGPMTLVSWAALLYNGLIVSGYCFGANALLLRRYGASQVSVFSFGTPIVGVLLGVLMRGDVLSVRLFAGGLFVAAGIYLVNKQTTARRAVRQNA